jgi:hypothetical protein
MGLFNKIHRWLFYVQWILKRVVNLNRILNQKVKK